MKETADGGALTCGREQNADSLAEDGKNIEIKRMIKENMMKRNGEMGAFLWEKRFPSAYSMCWRCLWQT